MTDMFTAKEMQNLLHVDRSTIYRMAEAGQLPAIKVGKQWRCPAEHVEPWMGAHSTATARGRNRIQGPDDIIAH
jgi:excisionase family DNA binding protein